MISAGSTAWVLVSAALVMLMTPGLAFFYGGMVRGKSVLNMLMMNFTCLAVVGVLWVLYGYSLAFGDDIGAGLLGGLDFALLSHGVSGVLVGAEGDRVPMLAFVMFQLMFAILTPALISGAVADRTRFWPWTVFVALWVTVVYFPVAHWVFAFDGFVAESGGWIANALGALDFAGGTAVHINAGAAGLALALVLGRRRGWPREPMRPHNLPLVLLGAGLLWFGWIGFNAGSALGAGDLAALAFTNTMAATGAAVIAWLIVEQLRDGKPTTLGAASGAVAGLVAITPACAYVSPAGAIAIGAIAGAICALCVGLKYRFRFDDSLDVVAVHLVGGLVGTLLIGLFATTAYNEAGVAGLFYGGGLGQLGKQAVAAVAVMGYSFLLTVLLGLVIKYTIGFRLDEESEFAGIDEAEHAESGYELSSVGGRAGGRIGLPAPGASSGTATAGTTKEG